MMYPFIISSMFNLFTCQSSILIMCISMSDTLIALYSKSMAFSPCVNASSYLLTVLLEYIDQPHFIGFTNCSLSLTDLQLPTHTVMPTSFS